MAKRLSDDEIMDYTYSKLFGDLDGIRSGAEFSDDEDALNDVTEGAGKEGTGGIQIDIKPLMAGAAESGRPPEGGEPSPEDEEDDDRLKGIGRMSPLMSQLHGER